MNTSVFKSFVDKSVPTCENCPFTQDCDRDWYLYESGDIKPWLFSIPPDQSLIKSLWCHWPKCPRKFESEYFIDCQYGSLSELCRWAIERDIHKKPRLSARVSTLLRNYTIIKERPRQLSEHISIQEMRNK